MTDNGQRTIYNGLHRLLIPIAALLAVLPLLLHGPSCGHDFDFHVLSWFEAASQFAHLHYPHWAYTPAYNAGEPRFLFYPPLSWAFGAALGLVLPWNLVPAAFTFIALTLSGFTAHRLASVYAGPSTATLAAVLYLANPYMLFTTYERTAYGELLAAAWLPLLFLEAFAPRLRVVPLAVPVALLWLTNAPAAVMGCYALAFLTIVRLVFAAEFRHSEQDSRHSERSEKPLYRSSSNPRKHLALTTLAATVLGLLLSAFYLFPAAYERRFIQSDMATVEGMRIADNTLFHHMPPSPDSGLHDAVLHSASLIAVVSLGLIVLLQLTNRPRRLSLILLTVVIALLLTPISLPVWVHTPELRFLQFPWRLTALLNTILLIFVAPALNRLRLGPWQSTAASLVACVALILPAWHVFHQPCDDEDTVAARLALYRSPAGTDPTDEYTPTVADNDALQHTDPPWWLIPVGRAVDTAAPVGVPQGQAPSQLDLTLSAPEYLVLNRRAFPGWCATLNGRPIAPTNGRDDGLITLLLPAGHDTVHLAYHMPTDQSAGIALSALAAALAVGLQRRTRIR